LTNSSALLLIWSNALIRHVSFRPPRLDAGSLILTRPATVSGVDIDERDVRLRTSAI
jgi:hypothetical protein